MKLFDATLDLAAFAKGTEDYTVSAVNGRDLICNELAGRVSEFGGGTIWIRSGESAGPPDRHVSAEETSAAAALPAIRRMFVSDLAGNAAGSGCTCPLLFAEGKFFL